MSNNTYEIIDGKECPRMTRSEAKKTYFGKVILYTNMSFDDLRITYK